MYEHSSSPHSIAPGHGIAMKQSRAQCLLFNSAAIHFPAHWICGPLNYTALERLIDALMPAPAYVLGPRWEFLAWNDAQERLYPRIAELEPPRRNLLWVLFADPAHARADRRLGHPRPPGAGRVPVGHVERSAMTRRSRN